MSFFVDTVSGEIGFYIQTVPNASQNRVVAISEYQGRLALKVAVAESPVDHKANKELIKYLVEYFDVPKSSISLLKGHTSRLKLVSFKFSQDAIAQKLRNKGWVFI